MRAEMTDLDLTAPEKIAQEEQIYERMSRDIKQAFASDACSRPLKERTKSHVLEKMQRRRRVPLTKMRWAVSLACLLLFAGSGLGGYRLYYTEAATISIDVNPSIELGVNRWGKVVEETTYGKESEAVLAAVPLKHLEYGEALERLLGSAAMKKYLRNGSLVSITLENRTDDDQFMNHLQTCVDTTLERCHDGVSAEYASVDASTCQEAHSHGMSIGKYNAINELLEVDPAATVDEFKDKSMKEIKGHMEHCSHEKEDGQNSGGSGADRNVTDDNTADRNVTDDSTADGNHESCSGHHHSKK